MIDLTSISSRLLYCTVRVTGYRANDETSIGTAFFFEFRTESERVLPVLVTNRHLVEGCVRFSFLLHEKDKRTQEPSGSFMVDLSNGPDLWLWHPGSVDLCAIPIGAILHTAEEQGKEVFSIAFGEDEIPSSDNLRSLAALEDIIMVGYPIGLWDSVNNLPLLRKGITATHPAIDFESRPEGYVDVAAFPGSSGSPVVILNEGSYHTPRGLIIGSRFFLLGVLHAGPQYRVDGTIEVVDIPTDQVPIARTTIPVHLGTYVKSRELLVLKLSLSPSSRPKRGSILIVSQSHGCWNGRSP